MLVGLEGRQPHDLAAAAVDAVHPLHGVGIDAAHRLVQHDAAEHLDAGHDLHHERGAARRFGDVVLEYDAAHAARLGELRHIDVVHVAAEHVRCEWTCMSMTPAAGL